MIDDLEAFIATVQYPGWIFWVENENQVFINHDVPIEDCRNPHKYLDNLGANFIVHSHWTTQDVVNRVFVHLQFLTDHEMRENFTIAGKRPFEPHPDEPITGYMHEWFVEKKSVLKGY